MLLGKVGSDCRGGDEQVLEISHLSLKRVDTRAQAGVLVAETSALLLGGGNSETLASAALFDSVVVLLALVEVLLHGLAWLGAKDGRSGRRGTGSVEGGRHTERARFECGLLCAALAGCDCVVAVVVVVAVVLGGLGVLGLGGGGGGAGGGFSLAKSHAGRIGMEEGPHGGGLTEP